MMPGSKGQNVVPACTGVIMWLNLWQLCLAQFEKVL